MQVLAGAFGFAGEHVSVADVHAAGECDLAVHDERFAVVAEIDGGDAPGLKQGRGRNLAKGIFAWRNFR